ncbi:MAG: GNAT family N-acetyltransferase [Candidatus Kapabacteria bacterium]|nr:GNAT family N-acetyltransferase [Candidatus Kapabacteria bacterium]
MRTQFYHQNIRFEALSEAHHHDYWQSVERSRSQIESWMSTYFSPETEEATRTFLRDRKADWQNGTAYYWSVFDNEVLVGLGFINTINTRHRFANLGYWVDTAQTGRGYGTKIAQGLAEFAFHDVGLCRIELVIDVQNAGSRKVAEKAGAVYEGTLRNRLYLYDKSCDAAMYSLIP